MNTFVILFRQSRPLTKTEQQQRAAETPAWARSLNAAGHKLEPRILGPESIRTDAAERTVPTADAVTALLFLEAQTLEQAAELAADHPARKYGATLEVRPWAAPASATAQPVTTAAAR